MVDATLPTVTTKKTARPKPKPKKDFQAWRESRDLHPAYHRLASDRPLAECVPINHPRGKDGGWGS